MPHEGKRLPRSWGKKKGNLFRGRGGYFHAEEEARRRQFLKVDQSGLSTVILGKKLFLGKKHDRRFEGRKRLRRMEIPPEIDAGGKNPGKECRRSRYSGLSPWEGKRNVQRAKKAACSRQERSFDFLGDDQEKAQARGKGKGSKS